MTDREWIENSSSTVAPVVVSPLIDSNMAFTGCATVPTPATTNGIAPIAATRNQISATARNASRGPRSTDGSCTRRNAAPSASETAIAARNGSGDSP